MPYIQYIEKTITSQTRKTIEDANHIIEEYLDAGYQLTLRQLYYQFVARGLIQNNQKEYKKLGTAINTGRLIGEIDWSAIEDRTRNLNSVTTWEHPTDIVRACAEQFTLDLWKTQGYRVEVWIEKDALVGVIQKICEKWQVPYFSCRGYPSQSEVWSASNRLSRYIDDEQQPVILHLGDHDPSGLDMTRDIIDRTTMFTGKSIELRRLALNMDQVQKYRPPPNPTKLSDSRAGDYIMKHGDESWELDALEPAMLSKLIGENITEFIDMDLWDDRAESSEAHRNSLRDVADELESE